MKLSDLNVHPHPRGFRHEALFDNGFGVSVISEADGKHFEVAVMKHENRKKARLTFDTAVTNDVLRFCTVEMVDILIENIQSLPPK